MSDADPDNSTQRARLDNALAEYMERVDRGEAGVRERILADHPDLAEDLRSYFEACDELDSFARSRGPDAGTRRDSPAPRHVRYFGDYELIDEIGRGGMGLVFRARQISLNRQVALKMILAGPWASPAERHRFQVEAEAAARLDHPRIVPIHEIGEHLGFPFYSMKLIEGGSLLDHVARLATDQRAAAKLVATVARAVDYAHQRGILHRDLKPANILVDHQGEPHIADFGLAKLDRGAGLTATGDILGTPSYMSPEQARGKDAGVTTAADVYGLGAILYHVLTGSAPFQGASGLDILKQVQEHMPAPPRALNSRVDRDLETVTVHCLDKDPERRYRSARELADDLDRWLAGAPVLARPVGPLGRLVKWARRHPGVAALSMAFVAVALVGTLVSTWQATVAKAQWRRADSALNDLGRAFKVISERGARLEQEVARAEAEVYGQAIARADLELHSGRAGRAAELLDMVRPARGRPDLRRWEWHYLDRLCHSERLVLRGHVGRVWAVAYGPAGDWLVSCGEDRTARVWDHGTGTQRLVFRGHTQSVRAAAVNPGGDLVATAGDDSVVRLWSPTDGQTVREWSCPGKVLALAFSKDGSRLAVGGQEGLAGVWDPESGKEIVSLGLAPGDAVYSVSFADDDRGPLRLITSGKRSGLRSWSLQNEADPSPRTLEPSFHYVATALPHREILLVAGDAISGDAAGVHDERPLGHAGVGAPVPGGEPSVVMMLSGPGPPVRLREHTAPVLAIAARFDGNRFATAGRDTLIHVWDPDRRQPLRTHRGHGQEVTALAFSPDGATLASAGGDGTVRLWDTDADPGALVLSDDAHLPKALAFSPDGTTLATAGVQGTIQLWDVRDGRPTVTLEGHGPIIHTVAYHPLGHLLVSGAGDRSSGELVVWDLTSGKAKGKLSGHGQAVQAIAFDPMGDLLATAGLDGTVLLWNVEGLRLASTVVSGGPAVRSVAFSPDGRVLAFAGDDGRVRLWNTETRGSPGVLEGHDGPVWSLAFGPGGLLGSAGEDRVIRLWDWRARAAVGQLPGHVARVRCLAFDGDDRLASVSADGSLRVWDVPNRREVLAIMDHAAYPTWVAFSPDGSCLASCSMDGTTRLRSVLTREDRERP